MTRVLLILIRGYQLLVSPITLPRCRFDPSCSQYCYESIQVHGILKGLTLSVLRLFKCHPFHRECGYDPVPCKTEQQSYLSKKLRDDL